jgi:quercetin dioxygenase-like cupin family protein
MSDALIYVQDVRDLPSQEKNSILSKTLQNDDRSKIILFSFAPGQELSAHTAPFPATLFFAKGEATVKLGQEQQEAAEGSFAYMPPHLDHGIRAKTDVVMLLTMFKNPPAVK